MQEADLQAWNNYFLPGLILSSNEKKTHRNVVGNNKKGILIKGFLF